MKNNRAKKLKQANECRERIQKAWDEIERIEQNPAYEDHPDIKFMRIRACLLKIRDMKSRIRCLESSPLPMSHRKRKKEKATTSCANPSHPYSSGSGAWSGGSHTQYTHTNIRRPYSGGRCSPR